MEERFLELVKSRIGIGWGSWSRFHERNTFTVMHITNFILKHFYRTIMAILLYIPLEDVVA